MVYMELESIGLDQVKASTAVSYVDHNIVQTDSHNADTRHFAEIEALIADLAKRAKKNLCPMN